MFTSDRDRDKRGTAKAGSLLSWGGGEFGQHGHGDSADVALARAELDFFGRGDCRVKYVACGASHSAVLTENNEVYAWGNGNSGQLGNDDRTNHATPQRLQFEVLLQPMIRMVDCGGRHTMIVTESGRVFTCGNNFSAQLGYDFRSPDYKRNHYKPQLMRSLQHCKVSHVSCGSRHTLFLLFNGTVASCGSNSFGQLGLGDAGDSVVPKPIEELPSMCDVGCGSNHSLAVDEKGHVFAWGYSRALGRNKNILKPIRIPVSKRIRSIACGSAHSMLLSGSGTVYSFGVGIEGQLGHDTEITRLTLPQAISENAFDGAVAQISAGENFSVAITPDGNLYMWGKNTNRVMFSDRPEGNRQWTPLRIDTDGRKIAKIKCGSWHILAITGQPEWEAVEDSDATDVESDAGLTSDSDQVLKMSPPPVPVVIPNISSAEEFNRSDPIPSPPRRAASPPPSPSLPPVGKSKVILVDEARPDSRQNHSRCSCRRSVSPPIITSSPKATALATAPKPTTGKLVRRPVAQAPKPINPPRPLLKTPNIELTLSQSFSRGRGRGGGNASLVSKRNAATFAIRRSYSSTKSSSSSSSSSSSTPNLIYATPTTVPLVSLRPVTSDSLQRKRFGASPPRRRFYGRVEQKTSKITPAAWESKSPKPEQLKSILTAKRNPSSSSWTMLRSPARL